MKRQRYTYRVTRVYEALVSTIARDEDEAWDRANRMAKRLTRGEYEECGDFEIEIYAEEPVDDDEDLFT